MPRAAASTATSSTTTAAAALAAAAAVAKGTSPSALTDVASAAREAAGHSFRGLDDWIEVFKAGTHTDSQGITATFSESDLDELVANTTGTGVPAVLGHPKTEDRAFGWARLRREGGRLLAKFSDVAPEFARLVDEGAYRERSIAIYKDPQRGWVPRHIGWLGAQAPALALQPLSYSAAPIEPVPSGLMTFASADDMHAGWALADLAGLLRGMREWLISDRDIETADRVLPEWRISSIADSSRRLLDAAQAAVSSPSPTAYAAPSGATHMPQATATTPAAGATTPAAGAADPAFELEALRQQNATLTQQLQQRDAQFSALDTTVRTQRIAAQIDGWKAKGLLLPAEEPGLAEFMAALETGGGAQEFAFSAPGNAGEKKATPAAWFAAFMASRKAIRLGGMGGAGADGLPPEARPAVDVTDAHAIARAASEFQHAEAKAGRTVSVAQAVAHVTAQAGGAA